MDTEYTIDQAAETLHASAKSVRRWLAAGKLREARRGENGVIYITAVSVDALRPFRIVQATDLAAPPPAALQSAESGLDVLSRLVQHVEDRMTTDAAEVEHLRRRNLELERENADLRARLDLAGRRWWRRRKE